MWFKLRWYDNQYIQKNAMKVVQEAKGVESRYKTEQSQTQKRNKTLQEYL